MLNKKNPKVIEIIASDVDLELSDALKELIGPNRRVKKVRGDGQCGARAVGLAAFGDEAHGVSIREALNRYIVENYDDIKKEGLKPLKQNLLKDKLVLWMKMFILKIRTF